MLSYLIREQVTGRGRPRDRVEPQGTRLTNVDTAAGIRVNCPQWSRVPGHPDLGVGRGPVDALAPGRTGIGTDEAAQPVAEPDAEILGHQHEIGRPAGEG